MADLTETGQPHCGILIPEALTFTGVAGTDYDQADEYVGPAEQSSASKTLLVGAGTLDTDTDMVDVRVISGGAPNGGGAGITFSRRINGTDRQFVGQEPYAQINGYEYVMGENATLSVADAATNEDGLTLALINFSGGEEVWRRTHAGAWSLASVQFTSTTAVPLCIVYMGGGVWNLYAKEDSPSSSASVLALYQSRNNGTTWLKGSPSVLPNAGDPGSVSVMRAARLGGEVLLTITTGTGTSSETKQYSSGNLGHTFVLVETLSNTVVWDIDAGNGAYHIVSVDGSAGSGADTLRYSRLGRAASPISGADRVTVFSGAYHDDHVGVVLRPAGDVYIYEFLTTSSLVLTYRADLSGVSVGGLLNLDATTTGMDGFVVARALEDVILIVPTAVNTSGGDSDSVMAVKLGGYSGVNVIEMAEAFGNSVTSWDYSYVPIVVPTSGAAWTLSGGGVLALAADTGLNLSTGGSAESLTRAITYGSNEIIISRWVVDVNSGTAYLKVLSGNNAYEVQVTSALISVNDILGAAGTTASHGGTNGKVEIIGAMEVKGSGTAKARVWFRDGSKTGALKEWTAATGSPFTLTAGTPTPGTVIEISGGGNVDIYEAHYTLSVVGDDPTYDFVGVVGEQVPIQLYDPLTYLCDSMYVALARGIAYVDGVTHAFNRQSPYALTNVDPNVAPSPRTVWRSGSVRSQVQTLSFTTRVFNGGGYALVFDGIRGIGAVTLGGVSRDFKLRMDYDDVGAGPSTRVRPILGDASNADIWVSHDECKGWVFIDENNVAREVIGNTAGRVRTAAGLVPHATFELSSAHTGSGGGATGYLVPNRVALVFEDNAINGNSAFTLTIPIADQYDVDGDGYIQLGGLYVGRIQLLPLSPDLNDTMQVQPFDVAELPDGRRDDQRIANPRTLYQFAWVGSAHEWHDIYNTQPDHVGVTGDSYGNVDARALPALVEGLYRKADGKPVVWLQFPYNWDADAAYPVLRPLVRENLAVFGRIVDGFRREGIQFIGPRGNKQAYRVPALTLSEEQ